jgi:hypothetical protein
MNSEITKETVEHFLSYDTNTGKFFWKNPQSNRVQKGEEAGVSADGYLRISVNGKKYQAHRLVWLLFHGCFPTKDIDHIDGNRSNNRIENLREVTRMENLHNRTKAKGYTFCNTRKKYVAQLKINYKRHFLGYFDTAEEAREAYVKAKADNNLFLYEDQL